MNRIPSFNSPLMLGFDHLERLLDDVSKCSAEGYPPYNIEQVGNHGLRITLALAGFAIEDLSVSIEDNRLLIRGRKPDTGDKRVYLYRGIARRQFQRVFLLAEGIEVNSAVLDNGLLNIDLQRVVPEPEVRTIRIDKGRPAARAEPQQAVGKLTQTIDVTSES
jgi:HSP20 family molecular chaperone IbpA